MGESTPGGPTARELALGREALEALCDLWPGFRGHWSDPDNLNIGEDGSFTPCAVFFEAAQYLQDNYGELPGPSWMGLAALVRRWFDDKAGMEGALGACLVEPIEYTPCSGTVFAHVDRDILDSYSFEQKG